MSATHAHVEEWSGEDVAVDDVVRALCRLREESAHDAAGPDLRTSVMTHMAWVPSEWEEAAVETLAGLGERHPSRGILLFPEPDAEDGIDATVRMLAFPLREQRRPIAAEVVSNPVHSGTLSANVTIETPSAICLPSRARPEPRAKTAMPPKIGSQTTMLRIGQFIVLLVYGRNTSQPTSAARPTIIANA